MTPQAPEIIPKPGNGIAELPPAPADPPMPPAPPVITPPEPPTPAIPPSPPIPAPLDVDVELEELDELPEDVGGASLHAVVKSAAAHNERSGVKKRNRFCVMSSA